MLHRILFPDSGNLTAALQLWRMHGEGGSRTLSENARHWHLEFGLGVWLDELSSGLWTIDEVLRAPPGARIRPPMHQLVRARPKSGDSLEVWRRIGGSGAWLALSAVQAPEAWLSAESQEYRKWITEPALLVWDWFLPLLRARAAEAPLLADRAHHLDGITAYVRESEEDGGLLVWSRTPLEPVFSALGLEADA